MIKCNNNDIIATNAHQDLADVRIIIVDHHDAKAVYAIMPRHAVESLVAELQAWLDRLES